MGAYEGRQWPPLDASPREKALWMGAVQGLWGLELGATIAEALQWRYAAGRPGSSGPLSSAPRRQHPHTWVPRLQSLWMGVIGASPRRYMDGHFFGPQYVFWHAWSVAADASASPLLYFEGLCSTRWGGGGGGRTQNGCGQRGTGHRQRGGMCPLRASRHVAGGGQRALSQAWWVLLPTPTKVAATSRQPAGLARLPSSHHAAMAYAEVRRLAVGFKEGAAAHIQAGG